MAATGLFRNFTREQVLRIHAEAFAQVATPRQIMSVSGEGKSSSKQYSMPVERILEECNDALNFFAMGSRVVRRVVNNHRRSRVGFYDREVW